MIILLWRLINFLYIFNQYYANTISKEEIRIMKAIILVAGYASRLYPLTLNTPKALLTLGGDTLLDLLMDKLHELDNIDEVVLVSNDKFYNTFCNWANDYNGKFKITVLNDGTTSNETRRGAIGDIQFAIDELKIDDEIMVLVSDNYITFSFKPFYDFYRQHGNNAILCKTFPDDQLEYLANNFAVVNLDENSQVNYMKEKPGGTPVSNMGAYATYFYSKETVPLFKQYLEEGNNKDAPGNFPAWLYKHAPVYAYKCKENEICEDIGTKDVYYALDAKITEEKQRQEDNISM